ncbi:MAG: hypothetical protein OHK0046_04960 [Anaerolineae bacterium]
MSALPAKGWTAQEYLAFERGHAEKHEFIEGNVYLMRGANHTHNLITEWTAPDAPLALPSIDGALTLADIYAKVSFAGENAD